jgi:hypothetical protein
MTLATTVAGLLVLSSRASAQTLQTLVDFTATWKYDASTSQPATWTTNTFDDGAWLSGQGLLGFETTPAAYPVAFNTALTAPANGGPITYYFRIGFNFSGSTNGATLVASNLVDDACVVFLNGIEAGRLRVPAGQTATTLASGGPATEGAIEPMTLPVGLLRQGANVLAVEVHQSAADSSDVAWGTKLVASVSSMLSITTQPTNQTVPVGSAANFTVGVSGGPVRYFWQKETSPGSGAYSTIAGATNAATYTIASVAVGSAGNYRVIVSNVVNSVTSSVAALTVTSDFTPPMIVSAVVREVITGTGTNTATNFNQIDITFNESLANANVLGNYSLKRFEGNTVIPIQNAQYSFPVVRLTVNTNAPSNWFYRSNYYLTLTGLSDTSGNTISPTNVGVSWRIPLNFMQMGDEWSYYDLAFFNGTNIYSNNNWAQTNYVETAAAGWVLANDPFNVGGIYWRDPDDQSETCVGDSLNNQISFQMDPTLFRRRFSVATNLTSATLRLRYMIDDGAVFYLNGQEIHRFNMPAGPVNYGTRASTRVLEPACNTNVPPITVTLFPGTNWFAVAIYQAALDDDGATVDGADTMFGLEVDGDYFLTSPAPAPPPPPPRLFIARSGANVVLTWSSAPGYVLQSSPALVGNSWKTNGTWTTVPGAASGYSTPLSGGDARFFRLQQ